MPKTPQTPSPELLELLAADRIDLAARLLVDAFTPVLDASYPNRRDAQLAQSLGKLGSIEVSTWSWSTYRRTDGGLARLILELVLIWERAGVACRGLSGDPTEVVLLLRGDALLRGGDPARAVADELQSVRGTA